MKDDIKPLVVAAAGIAVGLILGWWLWHPRQAPIETYAPAVVLSKSDSYVPERNPAAPVPPTIRAAARELNPKAKLTRAATITVQPKDESCKPVDVELGVVTMPDKTQRIIARSDDGEITGGVDIPITPEEIRRELKWAAGASYSPIDRTYGAFIDRDIGPFRLSIEGRQSKEYGATALVRIGVRF
jgi:hypothetical protein